MNSLTQLDLFAASTIPRPAPAATPPASSRREHCPTQAPAPPRAITGDIPTMIVDGIKNTERYQP